MTQGELAEKTGISTRTISRVENEGRPAPSTRQSLTDLLKQMGKL